MKILINIICLLIPFSIWSQSPVFKTPHSAAEHTPHQPTSIHPVNPVRAIPPAPTALVNSSLHNFSPLTLSTDDHTPLRSVQRAANGMPLLITGKLPADVNSVNKTIETKAADYLFSAKDLLQVLHPSQEFQIAKNTTDNLGKQHTRVHQYWNGIKVYGSELILHHSNDKITHLNGRSYPSPAIENTSPNLSVQQVENIIHSDLTSFTNIHTLNTFEQQLVGNTSTSELVIYHIDRNTDAEVLAWHLSIVPNLSERWHYIIDAHSGTILQKYNTVCSFHHNKANFNTKNHFLPACGHSETHSNHLLTGPETAQAVDLLGITRTINTYEVDGNYFFIDGSRDMFNLGQSNLPDDPLGAIWTIDAQNIAPNSSGNLDITHVASGNNVWNNPNAVSAHYNAGQAYEYFKNTFGRNSINGQGGNIVSIINVTEDGSGLDNAFWNGQAMFYGNGNQAFTAPLAKSLDVAGHEMSHGVIANTANLEYIGQSGAMNESFADIFGVMIDRNDWQLGEDVSNPNIFPTGALRDISNPNNGGSGTQSNGWQPDHMNDFVNLPLTENGDFGGVHVNSGIPNHAFYLFANNPSVGKNKAEQVYYHALTNYLTKSAQFVDLRIAILASTADLHGANSAEHTAARSAFDQVGIFGDEGTIEEIDLELNQGEEFILLTDIEQSALYMTDGDGYILYNPLENIGILSKPSVTDDGTIALFIADDAKMYAMTDFVNGFPTLTIIQDEAIWRNVAISKDGNRLAALTDDFDNRVWVFDFILEEWQTFDLYNPTSAEGINSNEVQYADVIEWDHFGEFVLYDAFNRIGEDNDQNVEYWDIGFLQAWDNSIDNWGEGYVSKLFSGLPENTSVGNASFSKNSPNIVAYDFLDGANYSLEAANFETGDIGTIFENNTLSVPNYSVSDDKIIFDYEDFYGDRFLTVIDLQADKISAVSNSAVSWINDGKWAVWFATGDRDLTATSDIFSPNFLNISPNPFTTHLNIKLPEAIQSNFTTSIYNMMGQKVFEQQNETDLGLDHLSAGLYVVKLSDNQKEWSRKVVKK